MSVFADGQRGHKRQRDPRALGRAGVSTRLSTRNSLSKLKTLKTTSTTMMASSTAAIRLAALSSRGHAPTVAAALSTASVNYCSSAASSIAASRSTLSQKRSHHQHASSSSTQFSNAQWNGCKQMSLPIRDSYCSSILGSDIRWFSSKSDTEEDQASPSGSSQHNTWVEFQKSIAVSGFETGQTVREQAFGKKSRGGKIDRKRKEREAELEAALRGADNTQVRHSLSSGCFKFFQFVMR